MSLFSMRSHTIPKRMIHGTKPALCQKREKQDKKRNNGVETGYICKECIGIAANVMVPDSLYNDGIGCCASNRPQKNRKRSLGFRGLGLGFRV